MMRNLYYYLILDSIIQIQKRIIRIIMNSSRNASSQQLFKDLNILPIQSLYIYIYVGESSCDSGDGMGRMAQPLMFMMMIYIFNTFICY